MSDLQFSCRTTTSRQRMKPLALAIHFAFAAALTLGTTGAAQAQASTQTMQYNIPAGPLVEGLNRYALQSGVAIAMDAAALQGLRTPGLRGSYGIEQGFSMLLQGSGYTAGKTAAGYVVRPAAAAAGRQDDAALPAVTVSAASDRSATTEGSGSYTTRVTSAATGLALSLRETPQSVTVVTQQRIEDQHLENLNEVLANTTGISSSQNDGNRRTYFSRGFVIRNFQYDGIPTAATANWYAGESELDAALYDRVEIVRGATGLLTGAGDPSASINLVRKHADSKVFAGEVSLAAGSWNNYRTSVDLTTPLTEDGRIRGRVVAAYQDQDSYADLYHVRKKVFYGVVDADLTPSTKLSVGFDYQDNAPKGTAWGGLPLWYADGARIDFSRSATTATNWSYWATRTESAFGTLEHRFDNGWKINLGLTHSKQSLDTKLLYIDGSPDRVTGLGMDPTGSLYKGYRNQDSVSAQLSGPFTLLGRKHELIVGYLGSEQRYRYDWRKGINMATVVYTANWNGSYPEPEWAPPMTLEEGKITQQGVYGASRFSLTDSLNLIVGGRYSSWNEKTPETERDHRKFIPYAGLTYDLSKSATVYASYTSIFNPQDAKNRSGNYLDPIIGKSYEIGLKNSFYNDKLNTSVAVFRIEQDNLAQADGAFRVPNSLDQAYYGAAGVTSTGFEMDVSGEVAPGWNVSAGYSHYTAQDAAGKNVNTNQPRTLFRMFTTYRMPGNWNDLTVGGGMNWQSRNYTDVTSPNGPERVEQGAYTLVNLMARYQFSPQLSLQLNLNNVFDKKYYSQIGYYWATAWGAPRNAMATLNYKF